MSEQLRTMLYDAAGDHPDLVLRTDPWRRGRRIRLRRRLAAAAGVAVTATAVVAGTVLLTTPDLSSAPEPAERDSVEWALPDTLYEVPPNIADISDGPLREPAALVYRDVVHTGVYSDATRPIVVGARSGEARAVRDAPANATVALSSDGMKLAVAERWSVPSDEQDPPTVVVVELMDGDTSTHPLPDHGLGGGIHQLEWTPGNALLAVTAIVTTEINDDGTGGGGDEIYGLLDPSEDEWQEDSIGTRIAFSYDGTLAVVDTPSDGTVIQPEDGTDPVGVDLAGFRGVAFSPDGEQIAAVAHPGSGYTQSDPYALKVFDAGTGELTTRLELGEFIDVSLVGWGERGILIDTSRHVGASTDGIPQYSQVAERIDLTDPDNPVRTPVIEDQMHARIDVAGAFVDADTRVAEPPDAGFDWIRWVPEPFLLLLLGIVAAFVVLQVFLKRRRRAKAGPAAG